MVASSGSLDISASSLSNAYFTSSTSSFTTLVSSDHNTTTSAATAATTSTTTTAVARGLGDRIAERSGCGVPKFKSLPPPSLPISPASVVSPSSFFGNIPHGLSPAELLDSPILLPSSTILPSPTTGTFPVQGFNWNNSSDMFQQQQGFKNDENNLSDFSFQTQTEPPTSYDMGRWIYQQHAKPGGLSSDKANSRSEFNSAQSFSSEIVNVHSNDQSSNSLQSGYNQPVRANGKSDDGYNWRKYGQKHVKGSENPRSYYKCTYPNCPTKKKIETDMNGRVTHIVIKGAHNHPKPQSTRRSSSTSSASSAVVQSYSNHEIPEHSYVSNGNDKMESNSSISVSNDDFEQSTLCGDELGEEQQMHDAKRWKGDVEIEGINSGVVSRAAGREEKVVVQTRSDIDILDDGYRWRKYGQKVVKGNPNPRNYYKCTTPRCPVRKHVERAAHDPGSVRTTYEGKHNHAVPIGRGSGGTKGPLPNNLFREHADTAIKPQALSHNPNFPMPMCNSRPPTVEAQAPYTLEMLPSPGSFGYSRYD